MDEHRDDILTLMPKGLVELVLEHWQATRPHQETRAMLEEVVKFLFLVSKHKDELEGKFFPLTKDADDIWHFLIIQTREYYELCHNLPGQRFIHHRSISFLDYSSKKPSRQQVVRELLLFIPYYVKEFKGFVDSRAKHWKIISILLEEQHMTLSQVNGLMV